MALDAEHERLEIGAGGGLNHDLGRCTAVCSTRHCIAVSIMSYTSRNGVQVHRRRLQTCSCSHIMPQKLQSCRVAIHLNPVNKAETRGFSSTSDLSQAPGSAGESLLGARGAAALASTDCPDPLSAAVAELKAAPTVAKGGSQGLLLCRCLGSSVSGSARQ